MTDVFTKAKRREVMSKIRGRGNKETELVLMEIFRANGISGWRRNQPVYGRPDFVFPRIRLAVFVDGCFWHGCPKPKHSPLPKTRREWWKAKLERNQARDREVTRTLRRRGWRVLRIWEHELKHPSRVVSRINRTIAKVTT